MPHGQRLAVFISKLTIEIALGQIRKVSVFWSVNISECVPQTRFGRKYEQTCFLCHSNVNDEANSNLYFLALS